MFPIISNQTYYNSYDLALFNIIRSCYWEKFRIICTPLIFNCTWISAIVMRGGHDEDAIIYSVTNCFSGVPLNTFMDATEAEIWNIIKLSPVNSCELDPVPTWLLKDCKAELVPLITYIVNMSFRKSMIPKSLKTALIRPL